MSKNISFHVNRCDVNNPPANHRETKDFKRTLYGLSEELDVQHKACLQRLLILCEEEHVENNIVNLALSNQTFCKEQPQSGLRSTEENKPSSTTGEA